MNRQSVWSATLAVAIGLTALPASAAPVAIDFSFGGVTGTFFGLNSGTTTIQGATSFDLQSPSDLYLDVTFGLFINQFVFDDQGQLSFLNFLSNTEIVGQATAKSLVLLECNLGFGSCTIIEADFQIASSGPTTITSPATFTVRELTPIPLPAGGLLLLTGLAAAAGLGYRKKRAA